VPATAGDDTRTDRTGGACRWPPMTRFKRLAANGFLVMISVAISLIMLEIVTRLYFGIPVLQYRNYASEKIFANSLAVRGVFHSYLGWTFPRNPDINPEGMLPRPEGAPPLAPGRTILVVGDSFATGYQTEERWSSQLESLSGLPVVNGATGGWGIDQIFLRARMLVPELKPRLLIFSYIPNDMRRAELSVFLGSPKPYFLIENGQAELKGTPVEEYQPSGRHIGWIRKIFGYSQAVLRVMIGVGLEERWMAAGLENRASPGGQDSAAIGCLLAQNLRAMKDAGLVGDVLMFPQLAYPDMTAEGDTARFLEKSRKFAACARAQGLMVADPFALLKRRIDGDPDGHEAALGKYWRYPLRDPHHWATGDRLMAKFLTPIVVRTVEGNLSPTVEGISRALDDDFAGAIDLYDKTLEDGPTFEALLLRGKAYENLGEDDRALADYSSVIELRPDRTLAYVRRSILRERLGDMDGARDDIRKAYARIPMSVLIEYRMRKLGLESEMTPPAPPKKDD
jgi:hypothetical protein